MNKYTNLVLSSGSFYSFSFIGCLKYLEDIDILKDIKNFVGTSGGSLVCLFYVIGYSPIEIYNFIVSECVGKDIVKYDLTSILSLTTTLGLCDHSKIKDILEKALINKQYEKTATIIDVVKKTGKNIVFCTCNINKGIPEYLSVDSHPDIPIITATLMSCCIPILFQPIKYNDEYYLDGGIVDPFPYSICESVQLNCKNTLCIAVCFSKPKFVVNELDNINFVDYFQHIIELYKYYTFKTPSEDKGYSFIKINFENRDDLFNFNGFELEVLNKYIEEGYMSAKKYFKI
jgi:NTE family protein